VLERVKRAMVEEREGSPPGSFSMVTRIMWSSGWSEGDSRGRGGGFWEWRIDRVGDGGGRWGGVWGSRVGVGGAAERARR
jgi:hypothetical protein